MNWMMSYDSDDVFGSLTYFAGFFRSCNITLPCLHEFLFSKCNAKYTYLLYLWINALNAINNSCIIFHIFRWVTFDHSWNCMTLFLFTLFFIYLIIVPWNKSVTLTAPCLTVKIWHIFCIQCKIITIRGGDELGSPFLFPKRLELKF